MCDYWQHEDGEDFCFVGWNEYFDNTFMEYFSLLEKRTERMLDLDLKSLDYGTYRDMCLVMLRAILMENKSNKNNYTVQNYFVRHGREDLAKEINDYLETKINKIYTLREVLKMTVDKCIAHNETLVKRDCNGDESEIKMEIIFKKELFLHDITRRDYPYTIERIVSKIKSVLGKL